MQDDILLMSKLFESGIPTREKTLEVSHKSTPNLVKVKYSQRLISIKIM
ncbi:uncharacterized protein METZ01_LOCUS144969 [marine metagenome]|uniref:Uncharacterized protein n=1 Tax=marine metagenome TaxID=408172 RepID=A0A381ZS59_9ZZZZ